MRSTDPNRDPAYRAWSAMKRRCYNPRVHNFKYYGARGVTVCERWRTNFAAFLTDMGPKPDGMTLDRFPDKRGNYEPGNCRWATQKTQMNNTSANRYVELNGETHTVAEWAERLGIPAARLYARIVKLKMPPAIALSLGKRSCKGMLGRGARTW